eukprot:CAMPEP_0174282654 /NCGR_PEP_ID=MMETSP0809-20121228/3203_1 /TAXON_ID=73025 ORGANISM="Eutreptiella gymnastica-like, Strain CCMP1594" /NCGR_SAMPLE_ID=MMETSP0809 /ASSEMBLY_ACC=CAM_ASM_000658 /LENGTH=71 /DNA_ID=CAMNT_0015377025 /DNA_START=625 /DNA_END=840 /DNA_ORIENTATION=-
MWAFSAVNVCLNPRLSGQEGQKGAPAQGGWRMRIGAAGGGMGAQPVYKPCCGAEREERTPPPNIAVVRTEP